MKNLATVAAEAKYKTLRWFDSIPAHHEATGAKTMTTEEQIEALQAEVDGLRQAFAELKAAAVEEMRKCSEAVAGTAITPAFYRHQILCAIAASDELGTVKDAWDYAEGLYEEGVERGIYPKEQP